MTFILARLLEEGVRLQRYEALAIARELIARREGVPTISNVQLSSDGSATCIDTSGAPEVHHVAAFLQELLPSTMAQVPAALRYTVARGLGAVEAPPFESLEAFSESLARFEAGDHHGTIRAFLQRVAPPEVPEPREPEPRRAPEPYPQPVQYAAPIVPVTPAPATLHSVARPVRPIAAPVTFWPVPRHWGPVLAAIAASFVLGAIGGRVTLQRPPPTPASARPQAPQPP